MNSHKKKIGAVAFAALLGLTSCWLVSRGMDRERIFSLLQREGKKLDLITRLEVTEHVLWLADRYGMDPMLILAVMKVESHFDPKALSNRDARGLMQVRPIVVREVALELGISPSDAGKLLTSHHFNTRVGVHYLAGLIRKFGGDIRKALMAYNAGPTLITRLYRKRPVPNGGYQGKVLKTYDQFTRS